MDHINLYEISHFPYLHVSKYSYLSLQIHIDLIKIMTSVNKL